MSKPGCTKPIGFPEPHFATTDLKLHFPEIQQVQVGKMVTAPDAEKPDTMMLVMFDWCALEKKETQKQPQKLEAAKVREYEPRIIFFWHLSRSGIWCRLSLHLKKQHAQLVRVRHP